MEFFSKFKFSYDLEFSNFFLLCGIIYCVFVFGCWNKNLGVVFFIRGKIDLKNLNFESSGVEE